MQNFAAVIFDMDGLLLDTERLSCETFKTVCSKFDMGDRSQLFEQCIGTNEQVGKAILEKELDGLVDFEKFCLTWENEYKKRTEYSPIPLKNGVEKLLKHIDTIGLPMAVATSTHSKRAEKKLLNSGILNYFKIIIGGDQVARSKPDPEIYLKAASILSAAPSKCLAFEDSTNGVKAAIAAGMTVVQVPDLVQPSKKLLKLGHIVLNSLTDALEYEFV